MGERFISEQSGFESALCKFLYEDWMLACELNEGKNIYTADAEYWKRILWK